MRPAYLTQCCTHGKFEVQKTQTPPFHHPQPANPALAPAHPFSELSLLVCLLHTLKQGSQSSLIQTKYSITAITQKCNCNLKKRLLHRSGANAACAEERAKDTCDDKTNYRCGYPQNPHRDLKVNLMGKHLFPLNLPRGYNFPFFNPT